MDRALVDDGPTDDGVQPEVERQRVGGEVLEEGAVGVGAARLLHREGAIRGGGPVVDVVEHVRGAHRQPAELHVLIAEHHVDT